MKPELAIIGGSGFNGIAGAALVNTQVLETKYGVPSAQIETYRCANTDFYFLARHGRPHRIAPHRINYRANLHALYALGVRRIIAINSVGGIATRAVAGAAMIPDQIIDYTYGREHTFCASEDSAFFENEKIGLQHVDFTEPYAHALRAQLLRAAVRADVHVIDGGVYGVTQGPRLESAAEIKRLERDGCDIVGMTGMPEAALARELGIDYAALCVIVNAAAGKSAEPLTFAAMQVTMTSVLADVEKIFLAFFTSITQ